MALLPLPAAQAATCVRVRLVPELHEGSFCSQVRGGLATVAPTCALRNSLLQTSARPGRGIRAGHPGPIEGGWVQTRLQAAEPGGSSASFLLLPPENHLMLAFEGPQRGRGLLTQG